MRVVDERLFVDVALVGAPPLHREAPLRPVECKDVADLVAFLVKSQREQAARSVASSTLPAPEPSRERPLRAVTRSREDVRRAVDTWSLCDGPPSCGGLRSTASVGLGYPMLSRLAFDVGYDLDDHLTPTATLAWTTAGRVLLSGGLQARTRVGDVLELSARGLIGVGGGLTDHGGADVAVAPEVVLRARLGFAFVDVGAGWHVNLDRTPGAFAAVGLAFSGP